MLVDNVKVKFKAGDGGEGIISFDNRQKAFGGDGGKGGCVVLIGDANVYDLSGFDPLHTYTASNGSRGSIHTKHGSDGENLLVRVPLVTKVFGENGELIVEINSNNQEYVLVNGGLGGIGNFTLRGETREGKYSRKKPEKGEIMCVRLELNLKADVIILGYPNAGKSSIINALTRSKSKVASYEFTTLEPQLGVMDGYIKLMDLPGLIEGTYLGKGVGTKFLKHTQYSKLLMHCISLENDNIFERYISLRKEFENISPILSSMEELIVLTKSDIFTQEKALEIQREFEIKSSRKTVLVSTFLNESLEVLRETIKSKLDFH